MDQPQSMVKGSPELLQCLDAMPIAVVLLNELHQIVNVNLQYREQFEVSVSELVGKNFFEIHEGTWNATALRSMFDDSEWNHSFVRHVQLEVNYRGNTRKNYDVSHSLVPTRNGSSLRLVTINDTTPTKKLETILKRSEARTQTLLNSAVDAIVIINTRGSIKSFNPAAERLFGYSAEEVLGVNVRVLMPSPYKDEHDNYLQRYLSTREKRVIGIGREVVGQRKDGATFPMELSISEISDGEEQMFVGTVRDVTKAKRTEEALKDSEARGRAILSTAVDAIVTIDENGLIKSLNPAAQKMFGYTFHEMIGENVKMLMPSPYRDEHDGYLQNYKTSGIPRVIGLGREAVGRRRDGSTFPMELSVSEVRQGDRRYFTGIVRDITDRKRYEDKLRSVASEAGESELRVKAQAAELAVQAEQLRKAQSSADAANQAKSDFLANMSHEIRTPMTAILGYSDELMYSLEGKPEAELVEIIKRNGEHLLEIINDILDISKIESGYFEIEQEPCNPCQIVAEVESLLRVRAHQKGIGLSVEYLGAIPKRIISSPIRLRQVLVNLVGNAIKFTNQGQVRILMQLVKSPKGEMRLRVQIVDTGVGIPSEHLGRLFKPFSQADSSVARKFGGTGLGLALSNRLAGLMGGEIKVESVVGKGSTFTLELPTGEIDFQQMNQNPDDAEDERKQKGLTPEAGTQLVCRILLAEDGCDNRRLIMFILKKYGVEVDFAENGQQAVEMATCASEMESPYDVILMDMQMPVMDGYEATRQLREKGYRYPIIALTAHAMAGDREKCLAAGCDDYDTKPIDRNRLMEIIGKWAMMPKACVES